MTSMAASVACTPSRLRRAHGFEVTQVLDSFIGDSYARKVEFLQIRKACNRLQTVVREQRVAKKKAPQVLETRETFHTFISQRIVAEVEVLELGKLREIRIGERTLRATEVLKFRPAGKLFDLVVPDLDACVVVPAEGKPLDTGEGRQAFFESVRGVFPAAAWIPDRTRKVEVAEVFQPVQFYKFPGPHYARSQIDAGDSDIIGKLGYIVDGLGAPRDSNVAFPAQNPFGDIAVRRSRRDVNEQQEGSGYAAKHVAVLYKARLICLGFLLLFFCFPSPFRRKGERSGPDSIPVLEKATCRNCHNRDGVASATRLHFPEADAPAAKIEAFGKSLVVLVDREHPDQSLLAA